MHPAEIIKIMLFLLPMWIFQDGLGKLFGFLKEKKGRFDMFLYILTGSLALLVIYLIVTGHPIA